MVPRNGFCYGTRGSDIALDKSQENLSIFGPKDIIKGLTDPYYCTTEYHYEITSYQRKKAINVLGNIGKIPSKRTDKTGFQKLKKLGSDQTITIWSATHEQGELITEWILKEVDTTSGGSNVDAERLIDQASRLEQLSGVLGVPVSAPLIGGDGNLSLAIKRPQGNSIDAFLQKNPGMTDIAMP